MQNPSEISSNVQNDAEYSERHLGSVVLRVRSGTVDIADLVPNPVQPRMGPKDDPDLRKSIEENGGLLQPILAEPHPDVPGKYRIIDGERRWNNLGFLLNSENKSKFNKA